MGPAVYERNVSDLLGRGLYLDLPEWGYHVFECLHDKENRGRMRGATAEACRENDVASPA
jgi:hypothetical protein